MIGVGIFIILGVLLAGCCCCSNIPTGVYPTIYPTDQYAPTDEYTPTDAPTDQTIDTRVSQAGGATGDPQISLIWNNVNDLDLHCQTPSGDDIYYNNKQADNGVLDVDMNAHEDSLSSAPVENIVWQPGTAPHGHYIVSVNYYASHGGPDSNSYTVRVIVNGQEHTFQGTISTVGDTQTVYSFDL